MKHKFLLHVLVALTLLVLTTESFAQDKKTTKKPSDTLTFVKKDIQISKFYTEKELEKMPKLKLIEIYKERVAYLIEVIPFMSLHPAPGATFYDMSIPETSDNISHMGKEMKNKQEYVASLFGTLDDVLPYSEKANLIWSILYFDEFIKRSNYVKE